MLTYRLAKRFFASEPKRIRKYAPRIASPCRVTPYHVRAVNAKHVAADLDSETGRRGCGAIYYIIACRRIQLPLRIKCRIDFDRYIVWKEVQTVPGVDYSLERLAIVLIVPRNGVDRQGPIRDLLCPVGE
jgi:hypothetical protein